MLKLTSANNVSHRNGRKLILENVGSFLQWEQKDLSTSKKQAISMQTTERRLESSPLEKYVNIFICQSVLKGKYRQIL